MNIPFPVLTPRLVDSKWFNADSPCDEEAEIAALEHANQLWVSLNEQSVIFISKVTSIKKKKKVFISEHLA